MSELNLLFIGDIVGSAGRKSLEKNISTLQSESPLDLIVANGENAAHGFGLTPSVAKEIFASGVDVITGGNHSFDKREFAEACREHPGRILRPANYPPEASGQGHSIFKTKSGVDVGIINLMGRVFMDPLECPFHLFDEIRRGMPKDLKVCFLDFHAEATSEKMAMGFHIDGRASAMAGTHTHVQTSDAKILRGGTGFITDAGMTGPEESIIGMKKEPILIRFIEKRPQRMEVADGPAVFQGIIFTIDTETGNCIKVNSIRRLD